VKKAVFSVLCFVGSLLPDVLWRDILKVFLQNKRLMDRYGLYYISQFASQLNNVVINTSVIGDYGLFTGTSTKDHILYAYAKNGTWAEGTNRIIRNFFAGGQGTYLDIGANIGLTTVPIAAHSHVKCFVFEPDPTNFRNLKINISVNCNNENVKAFNLALFDRKTVLPFEISPYNSGDHRLHLSNSPGLLAEEKRQVIEVPCARLDDMCIPIQGPFLVKIDTQGAEPFVVAGGLATLGKADVILMEWAPYYMKRVGGEPNIVLDFLRSNFSTARINDAESNNDDGKNKPIADVCATLAKIYSEWSNDPYKYVDIAAIRS
jgi:FkbM family methyltransferase